MFDYPNKKKKKIQALDGQRKTVHANRGMNFEAEINESNNFYANNDIAYIYKKPTPIKVVRVNTVNNNFQKRHVISEAYYEQASTTDYNGIYKGRYIDFEAKQVKYKTFNIGANLKDHQVEHLKNVYNHGAIAFLLVDFTATDEVYLLPIQKLIDFLAFEKNKSIIPISYFQEHAYLVKRGYTPRIDYLKIVDNLLEKGE